MLFSINSLDNHIVHKSLMPNIIFFLHLSCLLLLYAHLFMYIHNLGFNLQSDESIYERECGNMPGFAVYYRYPNSQRVTYGQFIKVS